MGSSQRTTFYSTARGPPKDVKSLLVSYPPIMSFYLRIVSEMGPCGKVRTMMPLWGAWGGGLKHILCRKTTSKACHYGIIHAPYAVAEAVTVRNATCFCLGVLKFWGTSGDLGEVWEPCENYRGSHSGLRKHYAERLVVVRVIIKMGLQASKQETHHKTLEQILHEVNL